MDTDRGKSPDFKAMRQQRKQLESQYVTSQKEKRSALRMWEKLKHDAAREAYKVELAEKALDSALNTQQQH